MRCFPKDSVILTHKDVTLYSHGRNSQSPQELLQKSYTYNRHLAEFSCSVERLWKVTSEFKLAMQVQDALLMAAVVLLIPYCFMIGHNEESYGVSL